MRIPGKCWFCAVFIAIIMIAAGPGATAKEYKMTTPIAPGVAVPDKIQTSIGTLKLSGGYPMPLTARKSTTTSIVRVRCRLTCWPSRSSTRPECVTRSVNSGRITRQMSSGKTWSIRELWN